MGEREVWVVEAATRDGGLWDSGERWMAVDAKPFSEIEAKYAAKTHNTSFLGHTHRVVRYVPDPDAD